MDPGSDEQDVISRYHEAYGHTVSFTTADEPTFARIVQEMRRCLRGERGKVTDAEIYGPMSTDMKL